MKFRSKAAELATVTMVVALVELVGGVAYRLLKDHWPSLGYWVVGGLLYLIVTLPAVKRGWEKADGGKRS